MIFATFRFLIILSCRFAFWIGFYFSRKRRKIAINNLNLCFPIKNKSDRKKNKKIARDSFISLGHSLADFLLLNFYTKKRIEKYVKIKNFYHFEKVLKQCNGLILSTAHFGSWELAAHFLATIGFKSLILYTPIKKFYWLEKFVKKKREIGGNILISKYNSLLTVYKTLKHGEVVSFITDQHCFPVDGLKVPFFGYKVWTHTAFIKLSLKIGAPIVPGFIFKKNLSSYCVEFFDPLYPQDFIKFDDAEYRMALASNNILEKVIRKNPNHWMWAHRRFKNIL
ncbi:hypothetical protein KAT08_02785 [Candidatus Babeliales bacterium]|nr:hypothetical protein [Candidatus Babeliales bacterium]